MEAHQQQFTELVTKRFWNGSSKLVNDLELLNLASLLIFIEKASRN